MNDEKHEVIDYLTYYTKTIAAPVVIAVAVVLILNKNNSYYSEIVEVEQINIENEFTVGNTEGKVLPSLKIINKDGTSVKYKIES